MKKTLVMLFAVMLTTIAFAQKTPNTVANYQAAAKYSPNRVSKMVHSTRVDPHWLKNSQKFWYTYETSEGKEYYLVDPVKKTKSQLFNAAKMAAEISVLTGDPFDAKHLPIRKLKFIKDEKYIQFEIKSKLAEEEEKAEEEEAEKSKDENGEKQEDEKEKEKKAPKKKKMVPKVWHFEFNIAKQTLRLVEDFEKPLEQKSWASVAPNQEYVIFSKNFNLYWMDAENYKKAQKDKEDKDTTIIQHQITTDGIEHYSYGGYSWGETNVDKEKNKDKRKSAWVAFSHDSKKFVIERTDDRKVKDLWVLNSVAEPRPTLETYKYHMAGEKEAPQSELLVFNMENKEDTITVTKIKGEAFKDQTYQVLYAPRKKNQRDDDIYFSKWLSTSSEELYFYRTSRDLKRIDLCKANTSTGEVEILIEERMNTSMETRNIKLINGGKEMIHWSERDGWAHFYLMDENGKLKNQITKGPWHCNNIQGVDEKKRVLYFSANGKEDGEDPYYNHMYKINFDGTGLKLLNKGDFNHSMNMNDESNYFVNNYSRVNTTPKSDLIDKNGKKVLELETADLSQLMATGYKFPEPFKVKAGDGITDIYGVMYKPFDFDSTKTYPIIAYVYPGPQTEAVNKSFSYRMDRTDRLAQFGFIVITIGNRGGHPARSKWYHNYGYGDLRDYGLEDKKVGIEQLANRFDFIDINKVGITGHSGGGFMSTAAMLVYPDFFKVAVSAAGNHENNIYNRWWSEKHHGVKEVISETDTTFVYNIEKNPTLAKNLKGKLLITTGDIDNNVHPANSIRMVNALIKANKRFDFIMYPGQRHGYGNMTEYGFWKRADYFCEHLLGVKPTSTDIIEIQNDIPKTR
jgi:dipeptidyl aminopeptidase/acylaminoacyl peptidase